MREILCPGVLESGGSISFLRQPFFGRDCQSQRFGSGSGPVSVEPLKSGSIWVASSFVTTSNKVPTSCWYLLTVVGVRSFFR